MPPYSLGFIMKSLRISCQLFLYHTSTQSGTKIRLRGKGVVSLGNPQVHGDHYVTVQIQVPTNLSADAKEKSKEFEKAAGLSHNGHGRKSVA